MKKVIVLLVLLVITSYAQEVNNEAIVGDAKALLNNLDNQNYYRKLMTHFNKIPKGELKEKMLAVAIIGARMQKLQIEFDRYVKYLTDNMKNSTLLDKMQAKNLSDMCQNCNGQGTAQKACGKCQGSAKCFNKSCVDGQVPGYDRVGGKFISVTRTCIICSGTSKCTPCKGTGEVSGACAKCNKTGYVYNSDKARQELGKYLNEIIAMNGATAPVIIATIEPEKTTPILTNKDSIEIDGVVYTREQIAQLEKKALENAKTNIPEVTQQVQITPVVNQVEEIVASTITGLEDLLENNPEEAVSKLQSLVKNYPDYDKIADIKKELAYCDLYREAKYFESKGSINKAIRKYNEVQKFKTTEKVQQKLLWLDEQTIGL